MGIMIFDVISAILFVIILGALVYIKRDKIIVQKIAFPALYIVMFRTSWGLKLMDRISGRFKELIKFIGYCIIGFAFMGMFYIGLSIFLLLWLLIFRPEAEETATSLILPFTNVAGIGFLSFWHWLIAIFILAVIHEFAHGVMARSFGIPVKSSGFAVISVFLPILPAAFVEPEEKVLTKKSDVAQYAVFAAGPMINIALAIIMLIAIPYVGFGFFQYTQPLAPFEGSFTEPVGFSYQLINTTLPAARAGLPEAGIISSLNGEEVLDFNTFAVRMLKIKPGSDITVKVNGTQYTISTIANPDDASRAYIGILRISNERDVVAGVSSFWAEVFYWFKGLLKWVFLLNFFVGLFNLLPMGIVDGGRMLQLALLRIIKKEETAQKIWSFIGMLLLGILLFAVIANYIGNPFSLLQ